MLCTSSLALVLEKTVLMRSQNLSLRKTLLGLFYFEEGTILSFNVLINNDVSILRPSKASLP